MDIEFLYYADLAERIFKFLNGKINRINTNILFIITDDIEEYGRLYLRSALMINLNKILKDSSKFIQYSKETNILFTICHELFHADQEVIDRFYLDKNNNYSVLKEAETDYRAISYITTNRKDLENILEINISLIPLNKMKEELDIKYGLINIADYRRYEIEEIIQKNLLYFTRVVNNEWLEYDNVVLNVYVKKSKIHSYPIKIEGIMQDITATDLQSLIIDYSYTIKIDNSFNYKTRITEDNTYVIDINLLQFPNGIIN